jgi:7SK snRNA methylphosphate capping enzyme
LKENAKNLKLRPEEFEAVLVTIGFGAAQHLGAVGDGGKSYPYLKPPPIIVRLMML